MASSRKGSRPRFRARVASRIAPEGSEVARRAASAERDAEAARAGVVALEAKNEMLRSLLDALPIGVQLLGPGGAELARNAAFPESSTPAGVLVRHSCESLCAKVSEGPAVHAVEIVEVAGPPRRSFEVRVELHNSGGSSTPTYVVVVTDVTERRRIDSTRRDFISNVGHELRTPVGAMSVLAETLVDEQDPETAHRLIVRLETETRRLAEMIDDLLSLSRVEADERPALEAVDVRGLISTVTERLDAAAETRGVHLAHGPIGDFVVEGDRRDLLSALTNLVDNAIKYSDPGMTVQMTVERLAPASDSERPMIAFRVIDQGIGIPHRDRERIFERFYRVDRARTRTSGGSGIGLAIVRHVAMNHGGAVEVESTEGMGSTFTLTIPEHAAVNAVVASHLML